MLTKTDKKIMFELDKNARLSGTQIARKLKYSSEAVNYNIRKLEKQGIITDYITVTDFSKLGMSHYKFNLKFNHFNDEIRKEVVNFLKKEKTVKWIADCEGNFDMMFSIRCKTLKEFEDLKTKLFFEFDKHLNKKTIAIVSEAITYTRGYILGKSKKEFVLYSGDDEIKLSKEELSILNAIATNSRASIPELSKELKITPRVIRYSINKLEKNEIISGYKLAIDYQKMDYYFFKLFINLQSASQKRINSFKKYCEMHPNFTYWVKVIGSWDMEHEIEVANMKEFYNILNDIRNKFSDIIQTMDSVMVIKEHKLVHA
ncbi:Lrp/AsnC family transcriptional regulator [Candidatus Woesearchaeota archaeon]|jgi:Lrp/AsnC family transcriptional regulator, leucine-responsive regulatory protein|nr:Lrp/AsnC family transcriptional regulator [Candidatus Woesearchaeota archaeon]MBT5272532.1 Lrp/AsnC family transcriptional regulator [Candidatus Woesearchaeota archaeon]MBT6041460.1 Lrp/AsnC family transcriptional regulator [Candidatus Woesearchaeota archaeon]MBT6336394.1 Lrp/AsnC family transcriptional regulator [Candidatus Woesearchaeota archaeon]MBT7927715.1 Lrp/AsnC family transcriptional regulator [Candidatus Woesearchaeota archaeon]